MNLERQPLTRWQYPAQKILLGDVFQSGKPPFAPFPTVSNILHAALCSKSMYNEWLYGIEEPLVGEYRYDEGERFHDFIAYLKGSLQRGEFVLPTADVQVQANAIMSLFLGSFVEERQISVRSAQTIWSTYLEPWVRRKLAERTLQQISPDTKHVFELSVASARVPFLWETGVRQYPLRGRVDEIDLTHRTIIERTIEDSPTLTPPFLKDYQLWLLWKILQSVPLQERPEEWQDIDFREFQLVLETPHRDFSITPQEDEWTALTHEASTLIHDATHSESPQVIRDIFERAKCRPGDDSSHNRLHCFPRTYYYPQCRPAMRLVFQPWFRLLLWEQIWEGHLRHYQLTLLPKEELVDRGLMVPVKIMKVDRQHGAVELELETTGTKPQSLRGYEYCILIPYGTVSCGIRMRAHLAGARNGYLAIRVEDPQGVLVAAGKAIIIPPETPVQLATEPPMFLRRQRQKALFKLLHIGSNDADRAGQRSVIQLVEAIFGMRPLTREKYDEGDSTAKN